MAQAQIYLITGTGVAALQECYAALKHHLHPLPDDPDQFEASTREDGVVSYEGKDGEWEVALKLTPKQADELGSISGVIATRAG